jgi:phosphoglucomutase
MIDAHRGYTPTPVVSHAILAYNRGRNGGWADGIVITPSHNPPDEGGFKYNPPNGGPADVGITGAIEKTANLFLAAKLAGVRQIPFARALKQACIRAHDYITPYVNDLANIVDMDVIHSVGVKIGIDPLGGAAVRYWQTVIDRYGIAASIVNDAVDPTFRFMTVDWDGKIRMDCSSPYAMARLIAIRDRFDIAFANDTDADRHGIVCPSSGLMNPNHYRAPSPLAARRRHRQDRGLQQHDRPCDREARAQAHGSARRLQMVQRRTDERLALLWWRGERRGVVPQARRVSLDDRQGRHCSRSSRGRNNRGYRA